MTFLSDPENKIMYFLLDHDCPKCGTPAHIYVRKGDALAPFKCIICDYSERVDIPWHKVDVKTAKE